VSVLQHKGQLLFFGQADAAEGDIHDRQSQEHYFLIAAARPSWVKVSGAAIIKFFRPWFRVCGTQSRPHPNRAANY